MNLFKKKKSLPQVSFEEILLDAENLGDFEMEHMEGRIETPLPHSIFFIAGIAAGLVGILFFARSAMLTFFEGDIWRGRATQNHLETMAVLPRRGELYDRFGANLFTQDRELLHPEAFSHVIGFVAKDNAEGKAGLEQVFDRALHGVDGTRSFEVDARGIVIAEGLLQEPKPGDDLTLTLDAELQKIVYDMLSATIRERGFTGGAGIVFDVTNGEVLALASAPGYDVNVLRKGGPPEAIEALRNNHALPFFNRAIAGRYHPGSIVKPIVAAAALEERVIDPTTHLVSEGALRIPDPYRPGEESVFLDWKAHGSVDMRRALAVSSNVYFYIVGGGYKDIDGLGIRRLARWFERFGLGTETNIALAGEEEGLVPNPDQKAQYHPENPEWRLGDTYHASIGQGDFLTTPLQIARMLALIANNGNAFPLRFTHSSTDAVQQEKSFTVNLDPKTFTIIKEGMRLAVKEGTAAAVSGVPVPIAGKTGTAEVGNKQHVHSWFMGFAPYENPRLGMVILLESGPRANLVGSPFVASQIFDWIVKNREYLKTF
ncbi:MAG: penicillin-binding transpeptidase domain-containing protein [Patescibacteria group bacterium]